MPDRVTAAFITPECRAGRGEQGAWDEATARLRVEYEAILNGWRGSGKEPSWEPWQSAEIADGTATTAAPCPECQLCALALVRDTKQNDHGRIRSFVLGGKRLSLIVAWDSGDGPPEKERQK